MAANQAMPDTERRRRGTGRQYAYDMLRRSILRLELPPGEMLDEVELVDQIGVSRTLIREAMIGLSSEGLVELLPNRGTRVAPLDFQGVKSFHEALELDQRAVVRWAATRYRTEHIEAIRRERIAFERGVQRNDPDVMIEANRDFHLAIGAACGNPFVAKSYARLLTLGLRLSRFLVSYDAPEAAPVSLHLQKIVDQHREIEALVLARDAAAAEALGGAHARLSLERAATVLRNTLSAEVAVPTIA
jgi:DNA-binding GntR family transcriptional regulator